MPPPSPPPSLPDLARRLLRDGPERTLATAPRRVRIQLGGEMVADTTAALLVWEHPYYPTYYVPLESLKRQALLPAPGGAGAAQSGAFSPAAGDEGSGHGQDFWVGVLRAGDGSSTDRVLVFGANLAGRYGERAAPLQGMVRVEFAAAQAWFEEDARIYVHPRDPCKRVDVVPSTRPVRILDRASRRVLAAAPGGSLHLYETGLPTRFYLPATSVVAATGGGVTLRDSKTVTACPYKGEAKYYDVVLKKEGGGGNKKASKEKEKEEEKEETVLKDLVWYYPTPLPECAAVAGCLCFYNEKVVVELDGKELDCPKSPFS
ncbi:DUF427-domain-containing protein [Xylariaceae sp. FL0804]|nr:DUF427-domain-containing protein [Xylariaceae sp. FL0804]